MSVKHSNTHQSENNWGKPHTNNTNDMSMTFTKFTKKQKAYSWADTFIPQTTTYPNQSSVTDAPYLVDIH